MQPTLSDRGFLSCTLCPPRLGCVYEVDSESTVRNANTVSYWYIPECPSDCATRFFSILLLLSATCASSYNGRVMTPESERDRIWDLNWMFPGNTLRWQPQRPWLQGSWWTGSVSPGLPHRMLFLYTRPIRNQPALTSVITLPLYGCVIFYPSTECMSTECPVTSLL